VALPEFFYVLDVLLLTRPWREPTWSHAGWVVRRDNFFWIRKYLTGFSIILPEQCGRILFSWWTVGKHGKHGISRFILNLDPIYSSINSVAMVCGTWVVHGTSLHVGFKPVYETLTDETYYIQSRGEFLRDGVMYQGKVIASGLQTISRLTARVTHSSSGGVKLSWVHCWSLFKGVRLKLCIGTLFNV
jgi:hypothetical protein